MRLTYKEPTVYGGYLAVDTDEFACVTKLGQLEDIEDELGIDLITFFKYLSAGEVFFINDFNKIQRAVVRSIHKKGLIVFEKAFSWGECDFTLCFNDYGKTWALRKEELEQL